MDEPGKQPPDFAATEFSVETGHGVVKIPRMIGHDEERGIKHLTCLSAHVTLFSQHIGDRGESRDDK